ncbi:alpha/beta fold hydrolase [Shewanella maritima]|uniref:alpha/beta fold hydrolase n=1 Tax=Shewanella maritima TaxID=2520507 RepID=UPI003736A39A
MSQNNNISGETNIPTQDLVSDYLLQGTPSDTLIVFAHGAGANMHHEFMAQMAQKLVAAQFQVLRFNFLYMQANMADGKRRPPDRAPKLLAHYESVLEKIDSLKQEGKVHYHRIVLVGKSMGGRMSAILMSDEHQIENDVAKLVQKEVSHVICLGYPFLPPKGKEPRLSPLNQSQMPILILQGERDTFGNREQLPQWSIRHGVEIKWIGDGDHSFKPRKKSGFDFEGNLDVAVNYITEYLN